jgi:peptidyl-prolyl cis-trans isomerase A (cyclophilin A)
MESTPDDTQAPSVYRVNWETSKGPVVLEVNREWAPRAADRFYMLTKRGFYDQARFFRVAPGFVVQFGLNAKPEETAKWSQATMTDDPVVQSNLRGTLAFAAAGPDTRTTQVFINLVNNASKLDGQGFAVFGRVVKGMELVEAINAEYGERPDQQKITLGGNAYLLKEFPKLDYIQKATATAPE